MDKNIELNLDATEVFVKRHAKTISVLQNHSDTFISTANDCAAVLEKNLSEEDDDLATVETVEPMLNEMTKHINAMKRYIGLLEVALEEEDPNMNVDDGFMDEYKNLVTEAEDIYSSIVEVYDDLTIGFFDDEDEDDDEEKEDDDEEDFDDEDEDDDDDEPGEEDEPVFVIRYYGDGKFLIDCEGASVLKTPQCINALDELIELLG